MTLTALRRTLQLSLTGALLTLTACATAPVRDPEPLAAFRNVPVLPVTLVPESAATPKLATVNDAILQTGASPELHPADYSDLFDRMRAGFKLPAADHTAIDRELEWYAGNPDYLGRAFSRADLYLYHIVTELEARGMPLELALLPVVESAFEPYAYSRSSASGLWQFIPGTGSRYNLKQDWWYDGRRDVIESTRAALDYLQALNTEFNGDWLLAIAAYNCGEMNVERAVARNQAAGLPTDFWNLKLPAETRAYVPKLLAMGRVVAHPENYGLSFNKIPNQPYFAKVDTKGQISMHVAAEIAGLSDAELYELNPAFHRWATDPAGPYSLLVPADTAEAFRSQRHRAHRRAAPEREHLLGAQGRHHEHGGPPLPQCAAGTARAERPAGQGRPAGRHRADGALGFEPAARQGSAGRSIGGWPRASLAPAALAHRGAPG